MFYKQDEAPIVELVKAGWTPQQILNHLPSATEHLIRKVRIALGMRLRRGRPIWRSPETKAMIATMRAMKQEGQTYEAIGIHFGFTRQKVHSFLMIHEPIPANATCTQCGAANVKLHRHHTNYVTDSYEVLCVSCHMKLHLSRHPEANRSGIRPTRKRLLLCQKILADAQADNAE